MGLRSPIVSVLGHVDHGKSSVLDAIRKTRITDQEEGDITQSIGASHMSKEVIEERCRTLLDQIGVRLEIPGLLFIDTPGHAAFSSLRKRGGSLADIAILVIDITEGFQPQTLEAIQILKERQTPFLICANKVDLIPGWESDTDNFLKSYHHQSQNIQQTIDNNIYKIVGDLYENFQMEADRYDNIDDFANKVAIVPTSATTAVGLDELLTVIAGISQSYLKKGLNLDLSGDGEGVILELKKEKGLGTTLDTILFNGTLTVGQNIFVGTKSGPYKSKVRALLTPKEMKDMRGTNVKYDQPKTVEAARGVKIVLSDTPDDILSGMPVKGYSHRGEKAVRKELEREIDTEVVETQDVGIIIKADTIGGLEALATMLQEENIPIRDASVGDVTKKDVINARASLEMDPRHAIVLGFNVEGIPSEMEHVTVHTDTVVYNLIKQYREWEEQVEKRLQQQAVQDLSRPAKMKVLRNCIFRQSNPCIVGVEIQEGKLKQGSYVMHKDGKRISKVKTIQQNNESVDTAKKGEQVALSLPDATAGRHIDEDDIIYTDMNEFDFRKWKKNSDDLNGSEKKAIKLIAEIKREKESLWGV